MTYLDYAFANFQITVISLVIDFAMVGLVGFLIFTTENKSLMYWNFVIYSNTIQHQETISYYIFILNNDAFIQITMTAKFSVK